MKTEKTDSDYKSVSAGNLLSSNALRVLEDGAGQKIEQMTLCTRKAFILFPMPWLKYVGCSHLELYIGEIKNTISIF